MIGQTDAQQSRFIQKGCYACQWLEYADEHTYANMIQIYHVVQELWEYSLTDDFTNQQANQSVVQ